MLKTKDGYAKVIGTSYLGSSDYLLLSNGDSKAISSLSVNYATSAGNADTLDGVHLNGIFTAFLANSNATRLVIGGVTKDLTIPYASLSPFLCKNSTFNSTGLAGLQYYDGDMSNTTNNNSWSVPSSGWHLILHLPLSVSGYFTELSFPVNDVNGLAWRLRRSNSYYGWYRILDSNNYSSYVKKIGTSTVGSSSIPIYLNAGTPTLCSTTLGVSITGNAATATTLQTTRTIWGLSFNGSANISGNMSSVGLITFSALSGTNGRALLYLQMADNDYFRIYAGGTASNSGYVEIATSDDGNEPIYVRQYTGVFSSVKRTLTLLDANGYTHFPSYINIGGNENNNSSPDRVWGSNGSDSYLRSYRTSALSVANADTVDGVHANQLCRIYTFNVHNSIIKVGTLTSGQSGHVCKLRFNSGIGYNAVNTDKTMTVVIRASNGSANSNGFYFEAHSESYRGGAFTTFYLHLTSKTQCELYMAAFSYSGQSTYEISFSNGDSWTNEISVQGALPTSNILTLPNYQIAYTDYNVASVTKLETARKIWGQSFDGTADISGTLSGVAHILFSADNTYNIGSNSAASKYIYTYWLGAKSGLKLELGANNSSFGLGLCIDTNLNVGIGTNTPAYKLHVNGTFRAANSTVSDLFINTGDATLKIYTGRTTDALNDGNICFLTSIDATDGQSHAYPTLYLSRCNIVLQPRGGLVYIGTNPSTGNITYKLYVNSKIFSNGGFVKNGSSDSYVLLGGGGHKLISDFATSNHTHSNYVTALGTNGNYLTWTKNGSINNITVPYATTSSYLTNGFSATYTNKWDCNAPDRVVYSDYGSDGRSIANAPSGWNYGTLLELGHTNHRGINGILNILLMWDVAHNTTLPGTLWFRGKDEVNGWAKSWAKVITDLNISSILSNYYTKSETDGKYVTLTTTLTIGGSKTFTTGIKFNVNNNGDANLGSGDGFKLFYNQTSGSNFPGNYYNVASFITGYTGFLLACYGGDDLSLKYRHRLDNGTWHPWKTLAFTKDIPSSLKNPHALTISLNGTSQGPYDGSAAKNINITPSSIGAAISGHNHDGRYLRLDGSDTMTGVLKVKGNQYNDGYDGAINMNNSDIYGLNSIYTADKSDAQAEGIHFWRDSTHVDTLRMMDGKLLFTPNRPLGGSGTEQTVLHTGNSYIKGGVITINGSSLTPLTSLPSHSHSWDSITGKPSSFAPSSHTHTWTSITDKLVAGNEFNIVNAGFNSTLWFNYRPINDASKTATISGYHFGNGAQGYASVLASGFVKTGSSSSYVLLGDGGHQTISSLSVNHALFADYIRSNALPTPANNTVKAYKDSLVKFFTNYPNGIGANVSVSTSIINNWSNDAATYYDSSTYSVIKISGSYNGTTYGQFLLSSYNLSKVGIVGRNNNKWSQIKWLAYEDQIPTDNNQLANGAGYITSAGSCAYAKSAGNADTVDGYHVAAFNDKPWGYIPAINLNGYMDIGKHLEFHYDNTTGSDYSTILRCTGNYANTVNLPSESGTLALTKDVLTFSNENANYLSASFNNPDFSKKAASKYIECWDGAGGWWNFMAGKFMKAGSSDAYVLLGGGGHKPLSLFLLGSNSYLPYNGWWSSGSGLDVNDANGMIFAYANHKNTPFSSAWGIITTFDYTYNSNYKFLLAANGYSNAMYYRSRSNDRGGWTSWALVIDTGNIGSLTVDKSYHLRINHSVSTNNTWSTWYWIGQSGQPTWLWGCNDGGNMYVWNPSNFSVKYATSAGSVSNSLNIFGVSYNGSAAKTVTTSTFVSLLSEGTSTVTDGTMFITSLASNSGFADTSAVNVPYKRKASCLWNYIDSKISSKYLPLAGGTMNGNARIGHGSGNLYIGNSGNDGWIYTQDIASLSGTNNWAIRTSGAAHFGNVHICSKSDENYDSSIIECYTGNNLYLNYYSTRGVSLCNGGGTVQIGSYTTGDTGNNKLYVNGSEFINGASNVRNHVFADGFRHRSHNSNDSVLLAGGGYSQGVPVRYWAIYYMYIGNSSTDVTYTKRSGNYNFITSEAWESEGSARFDISFPSGYNKNNTLIFGSGDHRTSSSWKTPVYVTITTSPQFGTASTIRVMISDDASLNTGFANIYFMCMG